MTDITIKDVPEGIVKRVKQVITQLVAQEIQRTELQPTQDQLDSANTKVADFKTKNSIETKTEP